jgi:hypothetical protein
MPPTVAQDVGSIIAGLAVGFLEQYKDSGVIALTSAQKQAIDSQLQGRQNCYDLQGNKISLYTDPEWRSSAENVGKRWITVVTDEQQYKLGRGRARYTEFYFSLVARLSSWKSHPHTNVPYEDSNGLVFYKHIRAKENITADIRCDVFNSFLASKWCICAECGTGTTEGKTIGKFCSECYVSNCIGNAIKRRKID